MDGAAALRIARLAAEGSHGEPPLVVEIGAGTGALTEALLRRGARVTALEIDPELVRVLHFRDDLKAAQIVQADALEYDYCAASQQGDWQIAGNLPYNIATTLIIKLARMRNGPAQAIVMLQKDVADRLLAPPGSPQYGSLTVAVNYWMQVKREFVLRPAAFYPRPKVHSTVVRLTRYAVPPVTTHDPDFMLQVSRAAFAYRRKTLVNSLALALGLERRRISDALLQGGLHTEIRGEQLSLAQFAALADQLAG
ncbi:MAG: 16S rRNA (adenine(1518)-N(6)/adenine(1519)-N(6))-dimethyltransferase RsmA [Candidatus Eremiobacteraeota bacterium]|nr:16S rRNA (adenine(1518)-N(6)/adenine(1519)-N(6))-dimethyltransferase RsmA [Candidatus Eremiobacteraeota bacterium]